MPQRRSGFAAVSASLLAILAVVAVPAAGRAQGALAPPGAVQTQAGVVAFSLEASFGQVAGTSYERVYSPQVRDFKLSELKWDIADVAVAGVRGAAQVGGLRLSLGYWAALNEGDGDLLDRDWARLDSRDDDDWSHESRHPDTDLDAGSTLDLNLGFGTPAGQSLQVSGLLGYRRTEWEWSARGGDYVYSWDYNGDGFITAEEWRTDRGSFPADELLIRYRQVYEMPYLGLRAEGGLGVVQLQGHLLYSPWVSAEDDDRHFRGSRRWEGDFSGGTWIGAGVGARWFFLPQWYAAMSVEYEKYDEIVGDVTYTTPEGRWRLWRAGGVETETVTLLLGAGVRF